jgi:hypothetical protein
VDATQGNAGEQPEQEVAELAPGVNSTEEEYAGLDFLEPNAAEAEGTCCGCCEHQAKRWIDVGSFDVVVVQRDRWRQWSHKW